MRFLALLLIFPLLICGSHSSQAFQIRELKALDFGIFTITDSGAHSIVVAPNGLTTLPDGGIHKMRGGRGATFEIVGADPATDFYVTINATSITHASGSPVFAIDSFEFDPPNSSLSPVHPGPDGSIAFNIGATLHVPPGTPVRTGAYRGTYEFMINF
ncbi:MAG: hypothetical protein JWO78_1071 [Micavibrio sp.]|nr:hypothetical protein [Micavibrio sp.]